MMQYMVTHGGGRQCDVPAVCREGQDPSSSAPWAVCVSDPMSAWISAEEKAVYQVDKICQELGYLRIVLFFRRSPARNEAGLRGRTRLARGDAHPAFAGAPTCPASGRTGARTARAARTGIRAAARPGSRIPSATGRAARR